VVIAMCESREAAAFNNSGKEANMRRTNRMLVLLLVVGIALLGVVTPVVAGQKDGGGAPKPDGRFQVMTTSISPGVGVSWADGRFSFQDQAYKFRVEAQTYTESDPLRNFPGQQIAIQGLVYNLKSPSDFAGTYTKVKPEVVKAMGGTGRDHVFQNDKGVVVRITRKTPTEYGLQASLLGDSFKVTMRDF
jgi:hypothetical protein